MQYEKNSVPSDGGDSSSLDDIGELNKVSDCGPRDDVYCLASDHWAVRPGPNQEIFCNTPSMMSFQMTPNGQSNMAVDEPQLFGSSSAEEHEHYLHGSVFHGSASSPHEENNPGTATSHGYFFDAVQSGHLSPAEDRSSIMLHTQAQGNVFQGGNVQQFQSVPHTNLLCVGLELQGRILGEQRYGNNDPWTPLSVPTRQQPPIDPFASGNNTGGSEDIRSASDTSIYRTSMSKSPAWDARTSQTSESIPDVMIDSGLTIVGTGANAAYEVPFSRRNSTMSNTSAYGNSASWPDPSSQQLQVPASKYHAVSRSPSPAPSSLSLASSTLPDILSCPYNDCSAKFTGEYRRGNLGRHLRQKHAGEERTYPCESSTCTRFFRRKDARLKHYRNYHPHLASQYQARKEQV